MLEILHTTIAIIVALGILVGIHEWGHFIVARMCGVKVLKFSIGFGQSLYSWVDKKGTEFVIAWIPLGGYVKMLDEREVEVSKEDLPYAFNRKPAAQRIAIVAAGPLINLIFAVLVYWVVFLGGQEVLTPFVGSVMQDSVAQQAGIKPGDEVIRIEGEQVLSWDEVVEKIVLKVLEPGSFIVTVKDAEGYEQERIIKLTQALEINEKVNPLQALGIKPEQPVIPPIIGDLVAGGAGEKAGLQAGDEILTANGQLISDWMSWVEVIKAHPGKTIYIELERNNTLVELNVIPDVKQDESGVSYGYVGVGVKPFEWPERLIRKVSYNPAEAFVVALQKTWDSSVMIVVSTWKLVVGDLSRDNLGGPIMIASLASHYAEIGLLPYIMFVAYISIVLGIMNLLPIPVLDGGHILFYLVELVVGKPIPEKIQEGLMKMGLTVLLLVMSFAIFNDVSRYSSGVL